MSDAMKATLKISIPPFVSRLKINEDAIHLDGYRPVPNWWWRMWYWLLLGWKWESI